MMNSAFSIRIDRRLLATLLAALSLVAVAPPLMAGPVALVGATVHPVDAEPITDAVVLIDNGLIRAVGAGLSVPADATRIDLSGLHLYPGFVHAATALGLTEIGSVAGTLDMNEIGEVNAALRTEVAVNHDSELFPVTIAGGVLSAHVVPSGGLIRGTSAVLRLDGWSWEEMVIAAPIGMHLTFPPGAADDGDHEDLARLNRVLAAARHWHQANAAADNGGGRPPVANDQLQALGPLLSGDMPLFIHAATQRVMETALDWATEQHLDNIILVGGMDTQYLAERLAADKVPVILTGVHTLPVRRWEPYDRAFVAPAVLHAAGVRFAMADDGGGFGAANARNLPFQAGSAAAFGLEPQAALKSVTLWPAEILGIADQLGSITPGKRATLFAASGDPLEPMTRIERVWLDGVEYDLSRDRQRRLYQRYRDR